MAVDQAKAGADSWKGKKRGKALWQVVEVMTAIWVPAYGLSVLSGMTLRVNNWVVWASVVVLAVFGEAIRKLVTAVVGLWDNYSAAAQGSRRIHAPTVVRLFYLLMGLVGLMGFYALFTYPRILTSYGGGLREPVVLVPTPRGAEVAALLRLPMTQSGEIGPVYLLTESAEDIVVTREALSGWTGTGAAVRIGRGLIDSIETTGGTTSEALLGKTSESKPVPSAPPLPATKDSTLIESTPKVKPGQPPEAKDATTHGPPHD